VRHAIKILDIVLCLILLSSATLSAQIVDSTDNATEKSKSKAVAIFLAPTILIGAGIATMDDRGWYSSQDAYECIQRNFPGFYSNADDYLAFLPAAAVYGLNLAGVKGKHNFVDRSLVYLVSLSLAGLSTGIIKSSTEVWRPDGSDDRSFPSSHTALAFVSATFLHEEYKDQSIWYGIAGYSIATAAGVLRMLNNKHWMSDVLVGAGLGILSTKIIYWIFPLVDGRLRNNSSKKSNQNLSMLPYVSSNHFGVYLKLQIQ
jgi:membrane-associated phospholipid phosphatase